MNLSVHFYRFLMQAYPVQFRRRFGTSVEQAFRDMRRDALSKSRHMGLALLWLQVLPDFLFSVAELVTKTAGDFLKWRLRLHWVVACSLGFALARCVALIIGREFYIELEAGGTIRIVLGKMLQIAILMTSIGVMQSWALAGKCFRKKEWVLYSLVGAVLAAVILQPFLLVTAPGQVGLVRWAEGLFRGPLQVLAVRLVTNAPVWMIFGALTGVLQAAAIRSDAISRYQWMRACAAGYFLSAMAGGFVIPYSGQALIPFDSMLHLALTSVVSGAVLGLVTSGPLERILFNIQADSRE
jgi:hypothetical protein